MRVRMSVQRKKVCAGSEECLCWLATVLVLVENNVVLVGQQCLCWFRRRFVLVHKKIVLVYKPARAGRQTNRASFRPAQFPGRKAKLK